MEDQFEQLAAHSEHLTAIIGNPEAGEYELIDIPAKSSVSTQGLCFIGIMGIVDGELHSALDVPLGPIAVRTIVREFMRRVAAKSDFLERLYSLPDERTEN